ncbi:MAG: recombinase family protein [Rickettsia endosymbiont of Ixodes persulcatus]|nr:recombinase family protein [Rickettsia endosymbiont of Ixodes persulcatus]
MPIAQRQGFTKLLDKMEKNDVLVVTKLDRLGRDAIDVSITVNKLHNYVKNQGADRPSYKAFHQKQLKLF